MAERPVTVKRAQRAVTDITARDEPRPVGFLITENPLSSVRLVEARRKSEAGVNVYHEAVRDGLHDL